MPFFTFKHLTYEFPSDVNVIVREVDDPQYEGENWPATIDFDFYKDNKVIAVFGGTDEYGNKLPTWEDVGIRLVGSVNYEDLS